MYNQPQQQLIANIIAILTSTEFIIGFIIFILLSYLLLSLFTWSLLKPLKYLSISAIIVGVIMITLRFALPIVFVEMAQETINIPASIANAILNPFIKSGIICIVIGVILMVSYISINKKK